MLCARLRLRPVLYLAELTNKSGDSSNEVDAASEGIRWILAEMDAEALPDLVLSHGRTLTVLRNVDSVSVLLNRPEGFRPARGSPFPAGLGSYNASHRQVGQYCR